MSLTNLSFVEGSTVFENTKMINALPDRLTHRYYIVETGNESYCFVKAKTRIKASEQRQRWNVTDPQPFSSDAAQGPDKGSVLLRGLD